MLDDENVFVEAMDDELAAIDHELLTAHDRLAVAAVIVEQNAGRLLEELAFAS